MQKKIKTKQTSPVNMQLQLITQALGLLCFGLGFVLSVVSCAFGVWQHDYYNEAI